MGVGMTEETNGSARISVKEVYLQVQQAPGVELGGF
jgi:hypothetical protein